MSKRNPAYEVQFTDTTFKNLQRLKELLSDEEKLADYLDYLHMQRVKAGSAKHFTLAEAKEMSGA